MQEHTQANIKEIQFPAPPRGIKAIPWRAPIWLYKLGLGSLFGNVFLLLTHQGRKSGKLRQAVLEIIHQDPVGQQYYVVSGFGTRSQWYQNIVSNPQVSIQIGKKKMKAFAKQLDPKSAGKMMLDYAEKNPHNLKILARLMGYSIDHSPDGIRTFGETIPIIELNLNDKQGRSNLYMD